MKKEKVTAIHSNDMANKACSVIRKKAFDDIIPKIEFDIKRASEKGVFSMYYTRKDIQQWLNYYYYKKVLDLHILDIVEYFLNLGYLVEWEATNSTYPLVIRWDCIYFEDVRSAKYFARLQSFNDKEIK
jgi:hypothetical protein